MNCKVMGILALVEKKGRCVVRLDKASGMTQITITKRPNGAFAVGTVPGSRVVAMNEMQVSVLLTDNRIFIEKWYA
ncbi:hypothetical protein KL3_00053 [Klebsiella phage KL3]|nr:hypothetical protein KL3_00053 [Klebsiella phage KL3]